MNLFWWKKDNVYRSCSELPLKNFLECLKTGNLKWLLKNGRGNTKGLDEIWDNIFLEYIEISKDRSHNRIVTLIKEITQLKSKVHFTYHTRIQLGLKYSPELAMSLQKLGYRFKYDPSNPERYQKDLDLTMRQSKGLGIRIREKETELAKLQDGKGKGEGGNDIEELLAELSKFQGYFIDPEKITVSHFIAVSNRYKKHVEAQKNGKHRKN